MAERKNGMVLFGGSFLAKNRASQVRNLFRRGKSWYTESDNSGFVEETNMENNKSTNVKKTVKSGITFGSALAIVISYTTWKSVGWAIFHGLLSWVYVIYFLLRY